MRVQYSTDCSFVLLKLNFDQNQETFDQLLKLDNSCFERNLLKIEIKLTNWDSEVEEVTPMADRSKVPEDMMKLCWVDDPVKWLSTMAWLLPLSKKSLETNNYSIQGRKISLPDHTITMKTYECIRWFRDDSPPLWEWLAITSLAMVIAPQI